MKLCFAVLMAMAVGAYESAQHGAVYAQVGSPVCVQCGGTPQQPACCGGFYSGWIVCWVQGTNCLYQQSCNYASPGCFVAGTLVETEGGAIAIEDLQVGDQVLGLSDDGQVIINEVMRTYRTLAVEYLVINGEISVTEAHPFFVGGDWVEAKDLRVGDTLMGSDGKAVLVSSVVPVDYGVRVFNVTVSGNHTFFADGMLVHNKEPNPEG